MDIDKKKYKMLISADNSKGKKQIKINKNDCFLKLTYFRLKINWWIKK